MPKTAKARSTNARADPLTATDGNASTKRSTTKTKQNSKGKAPAGRSAENTPPSEQPSEQPLDAASHGAVAEQTTGGTGQGLSDANYLILARLSGTESPSITRLLSLPPTLTFERLHRVLQIAFGWTNSHMHSFDISSTSEEMGMMGRKPRMLICPHAISRPRDMNAHSENDVTLADIYEKKRDGEPGYRATIMYEYDHGDGWEHDLALIGRTTLATNAQLFAPDSLKVMCLAGEGCPAAEDCGGTDGWEDLKEDFKHPRKGDPERRDWYKHRCINGDPKGLDPYRFDLLDVNDALQKAGLSGI